MLRASVFIFDYYLSINWNWNNGWCFPSLPSMTVSSLLFSLVETNPPSKCYLSFELLVRSHMHISLLSKYRPALVRAKVSTKHQIRDACTIQGSLPIHRIRVPNASTVPTWRPGAINSRRWYDNFLLPLASNNLPVFSIFLCFNLENMLLKYWLTKLCTRLPPHNGFLFHRKYFVIIKNVKTKRSGCVSMRVKSIYLNGFTLKSMGELVHWLGHHISWSKFYYEWLFVRGPVSVCLCVCVYLHCLINIERRRKKKKPRNEYKNISY